MKPVGLLENNNEILFLFCFFAYESSKIWSGFLWTTLHFLYIRCNNFLLRMMLEKNTFQWREYNIYIFVPFLSANRDILRPS